ncbi:MAG TPA: nicotinate (nicotinamide) nucleotide adenylyltransferase [Anseongella sp.]|nr:nicotinate (nicotinamide) nucleotide adenylyltransferase [Anseongella sp.]
MKVGLFFGSFNPVHVGHLVIAGYMAAFTELDKVWLVVSPHNPLKNKKDLIKAYDRLEMARLATEDASEIEVSDIEFSLPQPSYTIDTLTYLKERYPRHQFYLIMGSDNLRSLRKWKNYELLLRDYRILVYPRPGYGDSGLEDHPSVQITSAPLMEISSTLIRKAMADGRNMQFFVPEKVWDFMEKKGLYRK